jgi:hypothetical protein
MPPMPKVTDPATGRPLVPADVAAHIYGCSMAHIARLGREGHLRRFGSGRSIYYDLAEVKRLAKDNAAIVRERGGRPRKGTDAA